MAFPIARFGQTGWLVVACVACAVGLLSTGCGSKPKAKPRAASEVLTNRDSLDLPTPLRGTVGAEVNIGGIQPTLVSGYGFVVGLKGTGGLELDERIAATIEREMAAMGIGRDNFDGTPLEGTTPRSLLRSKDTAVVLVQAAIPPGAPEDSVFDVYVKALNATSLEGGRLWTTQLRLGTAQPLGGVQARRIGEARGTIFINPFSESSRQDATVTRTVGRVMGGGTVTQPMGIALALYNESHARARSITTAINNRFPVGPGDRGAIARGRTAAMIEVTVPQRYREEPAAFIQLIRHVRIDASAPEEAARRYADGLRAEPQFADDYAWSLEAIGHRAIPFARSLYECPEVVPRLAALRAGARLNDAVAAPHLKNLAFTGPGSVRTDAIKLLGELPSGPTVDVALRELLAEQELTVRVAAYEALASRAERAMEVRIRANQPRGATLSPTMLEEVAKSRLPAGMLQGVERIPVIAGGFKFFLDIVPFGEPLVYVTQQGTPRIVLFGSDLSLSRTASVSLWSNELMMEVPGGGADARIRYVFRQGAAPLLVSSRPNLPDLIATLAASISSDDPEGGLDLTYSEIVATLNELCAARATPAGFATESDRLKASLIAATDTAAVRERPETPAERELIVFRAPERVGDPGPETKPAVDKPSIVPIQPPVKGSK
ncbi:MAG: flagellar basal body P-ring protein FlgI [Phycisphaerales bacterium]